MAENSLRCSILRARVSDVSFCENKVSKVDYRAFCATGLDPAACSATLRTGAGLAIDCAGQFCAHTT